MRPIVPGGKTSPRRVQQLRRILGLQAGEDYDERAQLEVAHFQQAQGLRVDREVGPKTWLALVRRAHKLAIDAEVFERLPLVKVDLPGIAGDSDALGYRSTTLREDVAASMQKVVSKVWGLGGKVTSAGGVRPLNSILLPGRVSASGHSLALDHDLALSSGMQAPKTDTYVVTRAPDLGERRWRVWVRVSAPMPPINLEAVVWGRREPVLVSGQFLDLTTVMVEHGFRGIPAHKSAWWEAGQQGPRGGYSGTEWWHWSWREGLEVGETTYGDELLRVYTLAQLERTAPWAERDRVYGVRGNEGWW